MPLDHLVPPVLSTLLFFYAGGVFLRGGQRELRARTPGMDTLISMAITVAYGYSLAVSLGVEGDDFYWELATLLDVMLLGHWIEMRSVQSASRALEHLADMVPHIAHRVADDGSVQDVEVDSVTEGDRILIRPGEQVPVDGNVVEGASSMNEAFLTGESRPVTKDRGDEVVGGAVNGEGALTLLVTRTGEATTLSQIMRLVDEAPGISQSLPGVGRPGRILAGDNRRRHIDTYGAGLGDPGHVRPHVRRRSGSHSAGDRLPPRSWSRDSARHHERHLDLC